MKLQITCVSKSFFELPGASRQRGNGDDDQTNNPKEPSKPFCRPSLSLTRLHQKAPTFFIGGHNGAKMLVRELLYPPTVEIIAYFDMFVRSQITISQ